MANVPDCADFEANSSDVPFFLKPGHCELLENPFDLELSFKTEMMVLKTLVGHIFSIGENFVANPSMVILLPRLI